MFGKVYFYKPTIIRRTNKGFKVYIENIFKEPIVCNVDPRKDIVRKSYYIEKRENERLIRWYRKGYEEFLENKEIFISPFFEEEIKKGVGR